MTAEIPSNEDDSPLVEHYQPQDAGDDDTAKLTTTTIITTSSANPTISFTAGKAPRNISISNNYSNSDDEEYEASTEATIERKVLWPKRPLKSQRRNSSGQAPVILVNTETQTDDNSLAFVHRPECCISIPPPPVQPPPAHLLPRLETATTVNSGGTAAVELESYFYPSPTTCDHQQQALNRIYTTQSPKVISIYNVLLLDILKAVAPPPVDLDSFRAFCRRNGYENHLDFWLVIEYTFKHVKTDDSYIHAIDYILETYLLSPTRTLAKIPLQLTKSTQSDAAKFRKMAKRTGEINTYLFDEMQSKAFEVLSREIFDKFQQYCILNRKIDQSREDALWWKRPILLTEFFSYPNPVNDAEIRFHNIWNTIHVLVAFAFPEWIYVLIYGYFARALCGPRLDIQSYIVIFLMVPASLSFKEPFFRNYFVPGPPQRFAQLICGLVSVLALLFLASSVYVFYTVRFGILAVLGIQCLASIFFDVCILSFIFMKFVHKRWVPSSVRKACDEGEDWQKYELK